MKKHDCARFARLAIVGLTILTAAGVPTRSARATVSLGAWLQHSPDDISGFTSLTGDNNIATPTIPFTVTIEGLGYTTVAISTNGWLEFGGNTQGTTHPANACLPTATHTNPFLAAYWDDLNPFGTSIRYGTVGTLPNRTFIVDYEVDLTSGSEGSDDLRFQVQVHETSNLISVRYRDQQSATNGISATIGFQSAGGASAQPISCNGKVLDDNRPNEGWSVDAGRAGVVTLYALMAHSPDDITGFTPLSGDNAIAGVTLPAGFSVSIEGTSYTTLTIGTNGIIQFGTLAGANPTANAALPSSSFPNPTLFYFWDNLQTEGGNIRYGTVGTSPNRTFIVDFQENLVGSTGDKVNGQVQIHEGSSLINVKYRDTLSAPANGQTATIGFQGAGGASAIAYPLTFNGKILDDNRPDEGWSVHPKTLGAMSLHSTVQHSPDDISGFTPLTGNNAIAGVTLPAGFSVNIDGTSYTTLTIGTNGIVQFGTTTGANPTLNALLPNSAFPNPTIFYYWDDLQTEGGNIRYGTVGTSPHRTFIVDFQENLVASSGDKMNGQVQIHEGSNVISVKYRSTTSANANGQSATIGFQGAGGASATAYPLTFNGKILDDNLPDAGWSVAPLPICGNSAIETKEQCDDGAANGTLASCCSSSCTFKTNGTACTDDGNGCTNDQCNGVSAMCMHPNNSAPCSDGIFCNGADTCSGGTCSIHPGDPCLPLNTTDGNCSASCNEAGDACNLADPNGTACNDSLFCNGVDSCTGGTCGTHTGDPCPGADGDGNCSESCDEAADNCLAADLNGSPCTDGLFCNGTDTCGGGTCTTHTGDPCPGPNGDANCAESCDEGADNCLAADPDGSLCNDSLFCTGTDTCSSGACTTHAGDPCDGPDGDTDCSETCDEAADNCLAADLDGTLCRPDAGECDVEEQCLGGACPADAFEPSATACGSPGDTDCDNPDTCDGLGSCQVNNESSGFPCGDSSDTDCTDPDTCDGSGSCEDNHETPGTLCTDDGLICTVDECDSGGLCTHPAGNLGTECRAASAGQECDEAEECDGTNPTCPADGVKPFGTTCRAPAGVCDIEEQCDGVNFDCPTDSIEPATTVCRPDAGDCDVAENCDGVGVACPANAFEPSGTSCGDPSNTDCTNPDTCDGSGSCENNHESSGTPCASDGETCTVDECDGGGLCAHPAGNLGTECRTASAGQECDEAEECDGTNPTCPADDVKPFGTLCRADAGECDVQELCDGINSDCPFDDLEPDGTPCGSPLDDDCTNADGCQAGACDENHEPSGTECRAASAGQLCDEPEECDGVGNCPADAPKSAGVECRAASAGQLCDEAEQCDGSSFQCPLDGVKPSGTVCRADTGVCDVQEVCDGASSACPTDAFEASGTSCTSDGEICTVDQCDGNNTCTHPAGNAGTTCRADAGECDVAELCDGTNPVCPANAVIPNGTACTDDGLFCTGDETCQGGSCASAGDPCTSGSCDEPSDQCLVAGCETAPLAGCRTALKSIFLVKDQTDNNKDKLIWKWIKGQSTSQPDFANPQTTADYTLCVYSGAGENLIGEIVVPPSNLKWTPISTKGYKYKDPGRIEDGVQKIILKGSTQNKSKALLKGKGVDLPDLPPASNSSLDIDLPVRVQLVNEDNTICFEGNYNAGTIKKNEPGKFKAKAQ